MVLRWNQKQNVSSYYRAVSVLIINILLICVGFCQWTVQTQLPARVLSLKHSKASRMAFNHNNNKSNYQKSIITASLTDLRIMNTISGLVLITACQRLIQIDNARRRVHIDVTYVIFSTTTVTIVVVTSRNIRHHHLLLLLLFKTKNYRRRRRILLDIDEWALGFIPSPPLMLFHTVANHFTVEQPQSAGNDTW